MSTNEQRAAEIIHQHPQYCNDAAAHLAAEGLLAPDLPAPDEDGTWEAGDYTLTVQDGRIHYRDSEGYISGSATPESVREAALAWLAAAEKAERGRR